LDPNRPLLPRRAACGRPYLGKEEISAMSNEHGESWKSRCVFMVMIWEMLPQSRRGGPVANRSGGRSGASCSTTDRRRCRRWYRQAPSLWTKARQAGARPAIH
jgi:hypothetical protein